MDTTLHTREHDYKIEVVEMTALDHMRAKRYRDAQMANPHPDEDAQILLVFFYSILRNASRGDIPTAEVFLEMPTKTTDTWYAAVNEANPGVLPQVHEDDVPEEEALAKKG